MANSLGQLVVRLGLDANEFVSGLTKSEYQAKRFADSFSNGVAVGIVKAQIAIELFTKAVTVAAHAIPDLINQAAHFQDLEEKTGASAEALASFAVAAKIGGTSMDEVAGASVKLTKALTGVDDESKAAGAALESIGINIAEFKKLDPAAQMEKVAKALSGFADGGGKVAVAMALFGKAGADMLPFLKELGDGVGRVNILTAAQIKLADEWADRNARSRAELNLHAQALATEFIPALTAAQNAITAVVKEMLGLDKAGQDLKANRAILDFAEEALVVFAQVVEAAVGVAKAVRAIGGSFEAMFADVKLAAQNATPAQLAKNLVSGDLARQLEERNKTVAEANQRYIDLWNYDGTKLSKAVKKSFADQKQLLDPEFSKEMSRLDRAKQNSLGNRPQVAFNGAVTGSKEGSLLQKQLDGQIQAIKDFAEDQRSAYQYANSFLKGAYDDGLMSLDEYFQRRREITQNGLETELRTIDQLVAVQVEARKKAKDAGARELAENKISDLIRARALVTQKASQDAVLSAQEEERAVKQLAGTYYDFLATVREQQGDAGGAAALRIAKQQAEAQSLLTKVGFDPEEARKQAQSYGERLTKQSELNTVQAEYNRLLETAGLRERDVMSAAITANSSELETMREIGRVRGDALGEMSKLVAKAQELALALGTPEARLFADRLATQFRAAAAEADPLLLKVRETSREMAEVVSRGFEDAILDGKKFSDVLKQIEKDLLRIVMRQLVFKPFEDWLSKSIGGLGSGGGGSSFLGSLFGAVAGGGSASFSMGDAAAAGIAGGGMATGGRALPGGMHPVNEYGMEVLDWRGKTYLMTGNERGTVKPISGAVGAGDTFIFNVRQPPGATRQTGTQFGNAMAREFSRNSSQHRRGSH